MALRTLATLLMLGFAVNNAAWAISDQELLNNPEQILTLLTDEKIAFEDVPNPHWRADACVACHLKGKEKDNKMPPLRSDNYNGLCGNCHDPSLVAEYIHAVDIEPPDEFLDRMPEDFMQALERGEGVLTCIVCHDLPLQCDEKSFAQAEINPLFSWWTIFSAHRFML